MLSLLGRLTDHAYVVDDPSLWDNLRAPFADKLQQAGRALEKSRVENEAAIQAEMRALAVKLMASQKRLGAIHGEDNGVQSGSSGVN